MGVLAALGEFSFDMSAVQNGQPVGSEIEGRFQRSLSKIGNHASNLYILLHHALISTKNHH